jgi:hypothetical protein
MRELPYLPFARDGAGPGFDVGSLQRPGNNPTGLAVQQRAGPGLTSSSLAPAGAVLSPAAARRAVAAKGAAGEGVTA